MAAAAVGGGGGVCSIARMLGPVLLLFLVLPLCWCADDHFRDITKQVFRDDSGYLAAFADFNSDKAIDVFVLIAPDSTSGFRQLDLNQALISRFSEEQFNRSTLLKDFHTSIDSVMPADLNGDRIQDILIYSKQAKSITIYWGTGDYKNVENLLNLTHPVEITDVLAEPLLFDFNGDRIVDILTQTKTSSRVVFQCNISCDPHDLDQSGSGKVFPPISEFHSNSFVDLNGDMNPDILISTESHFEVWLWEGSSLWVYSHDRPYPNDVKIQKVGQSVFVDFDSSGNLSHLVQAPSNDGDSIYKWKMDSVDVTQGTWKEVFNMKTTKFWKDPNYENKVNGMMSLKSADLDQDGYPDFMTIVVLENGNRGVLSLLNRKCPTGVKCGDDDRILERSINPGDFPSYPTVTNLGFFDVRENGRMDVLITVGDLKYGNWTIAALENTYAEDACFIKVITVSGLCSKDKCHGQGNTIDYGYNQPGAVVTYGIIDSEGKMRRSTASQLYQTGHGSLQLPYILFGIGLSPNFVESLEVRMPGLNSSHQWTQIIPNSQMLVIPNPKFEPSQWQNKLFITPSRKMLVTGITLFGVVLVNVIIILVLHLMEKKADRIERQQQAHRFNFDAM